MSPESTPIKRGRGRPRKSLDCAKKGQELQQQHMQSRKRKQFSSSEQTKATPSRVNKEKKKAPKKEEVSLPKRDIDVYQAETPDDDDDVTTPSESSSSSEEIEEKGRPNFENMEVAQELLDLNADHEVENTPVKMKKDKWAKIADILNERHGFDKKDGYTWEMCSVKYRLLLSKWRKAHDNNRKSGVKTVTCRFYEWFERNLGKTGKEDPAFLVELNGEEVVELEVSL